ncbi:MAG TPA: LuxR C-terminal-related transcriptional regulator [Candidatus Nitrosotalea sp.]|nr:LuxR C-terminal-related transcriptional regulator [Candidatus Nitrosotalea sp.]
MLHRSYYRQVPTHYVGRAEELGRVQSLVSDAVLGAGASIIVAGEAGIGKSRFLAECSRVRSPAAVLATRCGDESKVGNGLASQIAGSLLRNRPTPRRASLFALLSTACRRRPLTILVDDADRADRAELGTLGALIALTGRLRLVVVVCYSIEPRSSKIGAEVLRWLESGASHHRLPPLNDAETELVIRSVVGNAGETLPSNVVRDALRCAQGNPRIAIELAQGLNAESVAKLPIPPSAGAAAAALRESLTNEEFDTLALCSIVGERFRDRWIVDLANQPPHVVAAALQSARDLDTLQEIDGAPGWLRFRRESVRQAIYASIIALRRRLLHERVAEYLSNLEVLAPDADFRTLVAEHWHVLDHGVNASTWFIKAAQEFAARNEFAAAAQSYERAAGHLAIGSDGWFSAAHEARRCYRNLAEWVRMIPIIESMLTALNRRNDPETYESLLWDLFYARLNNAEFDLAGDVAQAIAVTANPERSAVATSILSYALCYGGRLDQARELLATIDPAVLGEGEAKLRHDIALAAIGALYDPLELSLERVEHAAAIARGLGLRGTALCYGDGVDIALRYGDLDAARTYERKVAEVAVKTKGEVNDVKRRLDKDRVSIAFMAGDLPAARALVYASLSWRDLGRYNQALFAGIGVQVGMRAGDPALIDALFEPSLLAASLSARDADSCGGLVPGYAEVMLARGLTRELQATLQRCVEAELIDPYAWVPQTAARYGTLEIAEAALRQTLTHLRGSIAPAGFARAALLNAIVSRRQNKHIAACEFARDAAARFARIGYRLSEALALELAGDRVAAAALYARCGAVADVARLAVGQSRKGRRAPFGARLTPRELEVARLIARSRTTGEIARILELSARTVHHHVEAAFSKLGIHSRRELTEELLRTVS